MLISDTELLLKYLSQKDNRAYRHLYSVYYTELKSLAYYYVKDEHVAADLVQEVFVSLLEVSYRFTTADEVKYFLYSALKNKCISYYRKQKVRDKYKLSVLRSNNQLEHFWEKVLEEDVYAHLMAAIDTLPPQCRLVMQLSLEGLKISEIAAQLHISEETVKDHKKNGKRKLLQLLDNPFLCVLISFL